jgi:hypothetical protein
MCLKQLSVEEKIGGGIIIFLSNSFPVISLEIPTFILRIVFKTERALHLMKSEPINLI